MKFRNIMLALGALAAMALTTGCSMERVEAGNVGVKFNLLADDKGVQSQEVGPGRYFLSINEELYTFPTFTQNYEWKAQEADGTNESITFTDIDGTQINVDLGITHRVDPSKVNTLFTTYRRGITEINDTFLRNMVIDALNRESSKMKIDSIYGVGKADLLARVEKTIREAVAPQGIIVERLYWIGSMRLPPNVQAALNAKVEATQNAMKRENEVQQAKAEAEKAREEAKGVADSALIRAQAEAEAIRIRGEALRNNPGLVELQAVEKWDGQLPQYMFGDGAVPFVTVPKTE
jgi:regulator of protease activity HflC (stomatin/prohibitin superfamily)